MIVHCRLFKIKYEYIVLCGTVFRRKRLFWKVIILSLVQINIILMLRVLYPKYQKKKKILQSEFFLRGFWGSQKCSQLSWSYESLNDKTWQFYAPMAKLIVSHEVTVSCLSDGAGHFEFSNHVTPLCSRLLIMWHHCTHTYVLTTNPAFLAFKLTQFLSNDKDSVWRRTPTIYYSRWRHNRRSLSCSLLGDKFFSEDLHILKVSLDLHEQMLQKYLILKLQFLKSQKLITSLIRHSAYFTIYVKLINY